MAGDVNAEILSDGGNLNLIHDQKDIEAYQLQGERDVLPGNRDRQSGGEVEAGSIGAAAGQPLRVSL